jgi:quercetin dioxygenase-like cupin family protein
MASTALSESRTITGVFEGLPISAEATTSRVVVNNPLLRVVVFAMDEGQELTDHASSRAVVVQMLDGHADFTYAGHTQSLAPGDVVYLAPDEHHAVLATSPCRFALTLVIAPE